MTTCQSALLEPGEQAGQFRADDGDIGDAGEQGIDAVEHHTPGVHLLDRVGDAHEQPLEIIIARFLDRLAIEKDMIHGDQAAFFEVGQIEAKRGDIGAQIGDPLVEGNKHAGFVVVEGAFDQKGRRQQGLAAAGAAADQRRPTGRQAAAGEFIQAFDAARSFFKIWHIKTGD